MVDPNWSRWVIASAAKHFKDIFDDLSVHLFIECTDRDTADKKDYAEFRLDGPRIREESRNYYRLDVPINILTTSILDDKTIYRLDDTIGAALAAFTIKIDVFRFGDPGNPVNDGSLVGCMILRQTDDIRINRFGQIDETVRVQQATVEAHYRMYLNGTS